MEGYIVTIFLLALIFVPSRIDAWCNDYFEKCSQDNDCCSQLCEGGWCSPVNTLYYISLNIKEIPIKSERVSFAVSKNNNMKYSGKGDNAESQQTFAQNFHLITDRSSNTYNKPEQAIKKADEVRRNWNLPGSKSFNGYSGSQGNNVVQEIDIPENVYGKLPEDNEIRHPIDNANTHTKRNTINNLLQEESDNSNSLISWPEKGHFVESNIRYSGSNSVSQSVSNPTDPSEYQRNGNQNLPSDEHHPRINTIDNIRRLLSFYPKQTNIYSVKNQVNHSQNKQTIDNLKKNPGISSAGKMSICPVNIPVSYAEGSQANYPVGTYPDCTPVYPGGNPGYPGGNPGYPDGKPGNSGGIPSYPGGKPGIYPGSKPGIYPGGKPGIYPGGKPGIYPGGIPGIYPGGKPSIYPGGKPAIYPGGNPGIYPDSDPGVYPGTPGLYPGGKPSDNPGHNPGGNPSGNPGIYPGNNPVVYPGGNPDVYPHGNPGMHPGKNPGNNPWGNPINSPWIYPGSKPWDNSGNRPTGNYPISEHIGSGFSGGYETPNYLLVADALKMNYS